LCMSFIQKPLTRVLWYRFFLRVSLKKIGIIFDKKEVYSQRLWQADLGSKPISDQTQEIGQAIEKWTIVIQNLSIYGYNDNFSEISELEDSWGHPKCQIAVNDKTVVPISTFLCRPSLSKGLLGSRKIFLNSVKFSNL
ncbi:hypothetical protein HK096_010112, partial [Nowakowskiella sp. JEL0078]